jgi:hypothetical protein
VTRACLDRIEGLGRRLNCFITVLGGPALKAAEESERRHKAGSPLGPLDGVPIAVKDVFYISGVTCTAGSKILANNVATYDSTAVRMLKEQGAVLVGTTNMHEFAAGVTSDNPHYGPVRNPWDNERVGGGSSGVQRSVPVSVVPTVLFVWGPGRILPVRITTLRITEKLYDPVLLVPTHAEAEIGLKVLTQAEIDALDDGLVKDLVQTAYSAMGTLRQGLALANLINSADSLVGMMPF